MTREEAIQVIEQLYPADDDYIDTRQIGQILLAEAWGNCWRAAPTEVLQEYARLCDKRRD